MRPRYAITRDQLGRMRDAGMGVTEIARSIGCDHTTVSHWLKKFNLPLRLPATVIVTDQDVDRAIARAAKEGKGK